jgi:hypothetical protein
MESTAGVLARVLAASREADRAEEDLARAKAAYAVTRSPERLDALREAVTRAFKLEIEFATEWETARKDLFE